MTIAAGFVCTDGIVMCADSQESLGDYKFPVDKLIIRGAHKGMTQMAFAGAGHGPMIDMAISRIVRNIRRATDDYDAIEDVVAETLLSLYNSEFKACPVSSEDESIIELLIGIKLYDSEVPRLYKSYATAISQVDEIAVIGSGRAVQYQIHKLYQKYEPVRRVIPIAINLLSVAEVALRSVGGKSGIAVFHRGEGSGMGQVSGTEIEGVRRAQSTLEAWAGSLIIDLLDVAKSDEEFGLSLAQFTEVAVNLRVERLEEHRNLMAQMEGLMKALSGLNQPTPSTPDTSEGQPSPCAEESPEKES
jgi:hypothetical protein